MRAPTLREKKASGRQRASWLRRRALRAEVADSPRSLHKYTRGGVALVVTFLLTLNGCETAKHSHTSAGTPPAAGAVRGTVIGVYPRVDSGRIKDLFIWPIRGAVISPFGAKNGHTKNKGVDIQAEMGSDVRAALPGRVVFRDEKLRGFGKTVILDHGSNYQTVYAYNSAILVDVGDTVAQNQVIAKAGKTGRAKIPSLHFEVRHNSAPQNPAYYLPH